MWELVDLLQPTTYPFWIFEWALLSSPAVPVCSFVLFLSAVLCSAAGIGGGGIYVAVLMVLGGVSTHNAVPLSKAVVFFGAVASTVLNLRRHFLQGGSDKSSINFDVLRLVVPMALSGTFLGVLLNFHMPAQVIVVLLTVILSCMTVMVVRTAWGQHCEEEGQQAPQRPVDVEAEETRPLAPRGMSYAAAAPAGGGAAGEALCGVRDRKQSHEDMTKSDALLSVFLIIIVVMGGILRFHFHACKAEKEGTGTRGSCRHPFVDKVFGGHLESWMDNRMFSTVMQHLATSLPLWSCIGLSLYYGRAARLSSWRYSSILTYQLTALTTGLLAGLVGIGGGLIFSPFFLLMGLEPHVAVATSSTCVLFTSSSTTIQYLFTDRIMMSLAVWYGFITLLGSWAGTSLVHLLQDRFAAKRSYITWVVAAGVAISAGLSLAKFVRMTRDGEQLAF